MSNSRDTGGYGHATWSTKEEVWAIYDQLPLAIRQMIDTAPYKLSPEKVEQKFRELRRDIDRTLEWYADYFERIGRDMARKTYGPAHPAAQF